MNKKIKERKLKILAFSDIHGDQAAIDRMVKRAEQENVDLVIIAGDFSPRHAIDTAPPNLIGPFLKLGKKVLVLHGNNETETTVDFLTDLYGVQNLHKYSLELNGIGIFGAGSADVGPFPINDREIFEKLEKSHNYIQQSKKKIMVTHAHPSGSLIEKFTNIFKGSESVRKAIDKFQPNILICGHVHEAAGVEEIIGKTKVVNVAKVGKVIEI
ncbi:metallophosphoesterase family protein [Candidatus Woesearchaeota archaeon]|nr:metallophosphoesterase family protein [Candidatus Woesearchaeota archaeon]